VSISKKLLFIVFLTVLEVSITLWAAFQLSKGANFHRLNFLHLKYNTEFADFLNKSDDPVSFDSKKALEIILQIKKQPEDCLRQVGLFDRKLMDFIGTSTAIDLCFKDISDANQALVALDLFSKKRLDFNDLTTKLRTALLKFNENSAKFEGPIDDTVRFIFNTLIPLVVFISLFNILFISLLAHSISASIRSASSLLRGPWESQRSLSGLRKKVSPDLFELIDSASVLNETVQKAVQSKLEKKVADRTSELEHSNTRLEVANNELSNFSYRTSHDLIQPLKSIENLSRVTLQDMAEGEMGDVSDNLGRIGKSAARLSALVADILNLAKSEFDTDALGEDIDLRAVVEDVKMALQHSAMEASVRIENNIMQGTRFWGQKVRFLQVLDNLVSNGIKYSDEQKSDRFVKIDSEQKKGTLIVSVRDNGIGIEGSEKEDIFKMFSRLHANKAGGSGLGLYIVKKHLDFMGAKVEVQKALSGSVFRIFLQNE
jgi:signal transduction histidine kinase